MIAVLVAVIAAVVFMVLGHRHPRFNQPPLRPDLPADLMHVVVNGPMVGVMVALTLAVMRDGIVASVGGSFLGMLRGTTWWVQVPLFLVLGDLVKWAIHFMQHHVPLLWRFHRVHHSPRQMDALSHARSHPVEAFLNRAVFVGLFVVVLGIDPYIVSAYSLIDLVQGFWAHSNTNVRLGWVNYVLATQEFHHWHHARLPEAVDKNYGGFLSVWDWIFGTGYCPLNREVTAVGVPDLDPPPQRYAAQLALPFKRRDRASQPIEGHTQPATRLP